MTRLAMVTGADYARVRRSRFVLRRPEAAGRGSSRSAHAVGPGARGPLYSLACEPGTLRWRDASLSGCARSSIRSIPSSPSKAQRETEAHRTAY